MLTSMTTMMPFGSLCLQGTGWLGDVGINYDKIRRNRPILGEGLTFRSNTETNIGFPMLVKLDPKQLIKSSKPLTTNMKCKGQMVEMT